MANFRYAFRCALLGLPSASKCRINEPSALEGSQNLEYKWPCGSGRKYKQCCGKKAHKPYK